MRIIFVRHGHPDYVHDCLTDLGHLQATAAAERLRDEGIFVARRTVAKYRDKMGVPPAPTRRQRNKNILP